MNTTPTELLTAALTDLAKIEVKPRTPASTEALAAAKAKVREAKALLEPTPIPPAPPAPEPTPTPDIFYGTKLSDYFIQPKHTLSEVTAPDGSGDTVFLFNVSDKDGTPEDPEGVLITDNPRGEMNTGGKLTLPNEFWWSGAFWLPTSFPASVPGWWNLLEGPFGKPNEGSPPVEVTLSGANIVWNRNATGSYKNVWSAPYVRGKKNSYLLHIVQSTSKGANGLVEMWLNGTQVCSATVPTLDASNYIGPQAVYLQSYRLKGMFKEAIQLYHWPMKLGTTKASVS